MSLMLSIISIVQIAFLAVTYCLFEPSNNRNASSTVHFVLLIHLGVSMALALMSMRKKTAVTPNTIGLSLYTFAGSLSLGFISQTHEDLQDGHLMTCSILLTVCGILAFAVSWRTVYREKFQNLW